MLSIVVPLAPGEPALAGLLDELLAVPAQWEVLLVGEQEVDVPPDRTWRCLRPGRPGRAAALNVGAAAAVHDRLWFIHADTRRLAAALEPLRAAITRHPDALLYFDLDYYDGRPWQWLSAWGARWRSRWLRAPFGDQAFCLPRALHDRVGGYREDAAYGEDHLYARAVRAHGTRLVPVGARVGTSARMHVERGWLRTVCTYQRLWIAQAITDRAGRG